MKRLALLAALVLAATVVAVVHPSASAETYQHLVGSIHEHSGYSDGYPGTTPVTYYSRGRAAGLDFMGGTEHSDNLDIPLTLSEACAGQLLLQCIGNTRDHLRKWPAIADHARRQSTATFTAFRGFEWTSDRFGHINVLFSQNKTNAKIDGGYVTMDTFWKWLSTPAAQAGGSDGVGVFNHPGAKKLLDEPAVNWNDFAYVPTADHQMAGIEVYNDDDHFGDFLSRALDKGWHVGPVGAEDLHGEPGRSDYGAARWAKTVILSNDRSAAGLRAAMLDRRFYATKRNDGLRLDFSIDDAPMGSRLQRAGGSPLHVVASTNRPSAVVELVTSGGQVVGSGASIDTTLPSSAAQRYYFMRVRDGSEVIAYSAPIWVTSAAAPAVGEWLAGDLHVHTCFSHDAYCGPGDDNTGPEEFYTLGGNVGERFFEAKLRGLDYLAITDHNDVRSQTHQGWNTQGVIGIPGYENSLSGHAQMLGATKIYPHGDGSAAIATMASELRADGGVFQINHPGNELVQELDPACNDVSNLDWKYGFDVVPDVIEVWNTGHLLQPPMPAGTSNDDSVTFWECWLNRGHRVGATGGSDSHWLTLAAVSGPGHPTTWAFSADRSRGGVLQALKEGRTSVSLIPPVLGALRLVLEADADGDGTYEAMIGDEVPPGTRMRVRAEGLPGVGLVTVRGNGQTLVDKQLLLPGGEIVFNAPASSGWVRATLSGPDLRDERTATCDPLVGTQTTYCRNALVELALTSPIYLS